MPYLRCISGSNPYLAFQTLTLAMQGHAMQQGHRNPPDQRFVGKRVGIVPVVGVSLHETLNTPWRMSKDGTTLESTPTSSIAQIQDL